MAGLKSIAVIGLYATLAFATGCGANTEVRVCFGDSEFCDRVFEPHESDTPNPLTGVRSFETAVNLLYHQFKPYPLLDSPLVTNHTIEHFWPTAPEARQTYVGLWLQVLATSVLPQAESNEVSELLDEARVLVATLALNDLHGIRPRALVQGLTSLAEALKVRDPGLADEALTLARQITSAAESDLERPALDALGNLRTVPLEVGTSFDEAARIVEVPRTHQWVDPIELAWAVTVLAAQDQLLFHEVKVDRNAG